jgi:hypothetical protein
VEQEPSRRAARTGEQIDAAQVAAAAQAAGLPMEALAGLAQWGAVPGRLERYAGQVAGLGGCVRPVHLTGSVLRMLPATGEVSGEWSSSSQPTGSVLVPCGTRHAQLCPACAARYRRDTWHLLYAGLAGGHGRSASVRAHPRLVLTLTAPSFGPVHTRRFGSDGETLACRPRRDQPVCLHGRPDWCGLRHPVDAPELGAPLCGECLDWPGAVLWNAYASDLWQRWRIGVPRALAGLTGLTRVQVAGSVRIAVHRIAELQQRGAVHLHAIVRADAAADPDQSPPSWLTPELLAEAVTVAARGARISVSCPVGEWELRWGSQLTAVPIPASADDRAERATARYLCKYVTKDIGHGLSLPIRSAAELPHLPVPAHIRALIGTAWRLGGLPELAGLRLRAWAHQCGWRGLVASRTRSYSSSLTKVRARRAAYRAARAADPHTEPTVNVPELRYVRTGLDAAGIWLAQSAHTAGEAAREAAWADGDDGDDDTDEMEGHDDG